MWFQLLWCNQQVDRKQPTKNRGSQLGGALPEKDTAKNSSSTQEGAWKFTVSPLLYFGQFFRVKE